MALDLSQLEKVVTDRQLEVLKDFQFTVEVLASADPADIAALPLIGKKTADKIIAASNKLVNEYYLNESIQLDSLGGGVIPEKPGPGEPDPAADEAEGLPPGSVRLQRIRAKDRARRAAAQ